MSKNITKNTSKITYDDRCRRLSQRGKVVWLFGLSGSGKSTIGNGLEEKLTHEYDKLIYRLDGDNLRFGLNKDLGFSDEDRTENIRRAAEVAKLMADLGAVVLVTMITPLKSMRSMAKGIIGEDRFIEIYVKASVEACEVRDPKELYKKARTGEIKQFTGIDSTFEPSEESDLILDTEFLGEENSIIMALNFLKNKISY